MHPLAPAFILEQAAAAQQRGRFTAIGLFADISGFSAMTDALMMHGQHGAEILAGVMRAAFEPLILAVYQWGGFVAAQAGDSFTALFPMPEAPTETGAAEVFRAALMAAQEIRQRALAQPVFATQYGTFTVSVKLGLSFGEVAWGIISSSDGRHAAYYFSGAAIDDCAEAQGQAESGEVILTLALAQKTQGWADLEAAGQRFRLKAIQFDPPAPYAITPPKIDLSVAGRFFQKTLLTQATAGEFRQMTYLFVRLPTVRTEDQLAVFMQTVFELQDHYGGLLKLQFGDKGAHLILLWGGPVAYENDIQRALNFVLDLQTRTAIPIHGGLTHRVAHAGFIGSSLIEEYAGYGRGANLAARFMTAAPRGELWVDEHIAARTQGNFEIEYLGEKPFKGFAQPQKVYLLLERKDHVDLEYYGELVGRGTEIRELEEFVRPIFAGQYAGVAAVIGDPGMGKSRLVHECLNRLEAEAGGGFQVFLAQTDEILRRSLNPFRYWLRQYFGVFEMQVEARNKRSFNRKLDGLIAATTDPRLAEDLDRTRSFLGALVDLGWPDSLYEQMDAEGRFENTLIGLTALFCAEGLQKPVVFFLEDIHWLDVDSRAFLPRLVRVLAAGDFSASGGNYPIAIIATGRDEDRETRLEGFPYKRIDIGRLDRSGLIELAAGILGGPPDKSLVTFLEARAEGNPFFVEQILKFLGEERLLVFQQGSWRLRTALTVYLPGDLQNILVARLDRLADQVKEVVQTAAVLGREFEVRLLAEMLIGDDRLGEKVHQAEEQDIWAALSEIRYIFRHTLLRDAAYAMQIQARRQRLHALALETFERLFAADLSPHYGELAYHAEQASLAEKACVYLKAAGEAAVQVYQNAQAIDYFSRALALTPEDDWPSRIALLLEREKVYELIGAKDLRQQDLDTLEQLVLQSGSDEALDLQIQLRRCDFYLETGNFSEGQALAEKIMQQALAADKFQAVLTAKVNLCLNLMRQNRNQEAISQAQAGLELARRIGDPRSENDLLNALGLLASEDRRPDAAHQHFEASLQISQETGDLRGQCRTLNNLGMVSVLASDFVSARSYYEQSLEIAHKIGNRTGEGVLLGNLGFLAGAMGDYHQAHNYVDQGLHIAREVGNPYYETYALINLSAFTGVLGEPEIAHRYAEAALELASKLGDRSAEAWADTYLGHSLLALAQLADAQRAYRAALDIRHELNQTELAVEPAAGLAQTLLAGGDASTALECLSETVDRINAEDLLDGCDEPMRVFSTCYAVLQACEDQPRAAMILQKAYQFLQTRAERISDGPARQAYLNNNPHHRLILDAYKR